MSLTIDYLKDDVAYLSQLISQHTPEGQDKLRSLNGCTLTHCNFTLEPLKQSLKPLSFEF